MSFIVRGLFPAFDKNTTEIREAPPEEKPCKNWALPKLRFDPPYCANPGTLWHNILAENEKILETGLVKGHSRIHPFCPLQASLSTLRVNHHHFDWCQFIQGQGQW